LNIYRVKKKRVGDYFFDQFCDVAKRDIFLATHLKHKALGYKQINFEYNFLNIYDQQKKVDWRVGGVRKRK